MCAVLIAADAAPLIAQETKAGRPNFILCMTDDQGWTDVSYNEQGRLVNGKFKTPELDQMAAAGLRFDRFYAAAPVCSPTRGSCLTGRHPFRYGVIDPGRPLKLEEKTIAQALSAAGYQTGHFGKWHLNGVSGPGKPIAQDDPLNPGAFGFQTWFSVSNFFEANWTFSRGGTPVATKGDGSDVIVAEALKWLDSLQKVKSAQPFFAVIWFGNPHVPHKPLPADLEAAGGNAELGEIAGVDRAMGALRKGLQERGLASNTMLWFNSDNGRPGENKPLKGGKSGIYEGGIRVPGICEWPGRVKPGHTSIPVVTSDFYPTILEAAGIAMPKDKPQPIDGISLLPLLAGKMTERPSPIGFMTGNATALSDNRYKLVVSGEGKQLYDLTNDLGEMKDLSSEKPEIVTRMSQTLDNWTASVRNSKTGSDYRK
ncbi:MAG: sulfatase-like hydrolase/transferase [Verrucomicrobia bacterium]|nr:sulfatase-like hydrolase/transferase [Verrucomicrobiota bacterium]